MLVNYSLLPDTSVGYLQLLPSPWNLDNTILAVLGNTTDGIPMAGATLIKDDLIARLSGNFAVLYGDQAVSTDTRLGVGKENIISQLPVAVTVTPEQAESTAQVSGEKIVSRPLWIIPLFGIITVSILILLMVMLTRESRAKKMPKEGKSREHSPSEPIK
jgi:hypothetical protein